MYPNYFNLTLTSRSDVKMNITECAGYNKLIAAIENDEKNSSGMHDYREKLQWIVNRVQHYADKTGLNPSDILDAWEANRDYWYMNYYQDCNQPEIKGDSVRVFDDIPQAQASIGQHEFRCPSCSGISSDPNKCNASDNCNWASYGLFGTMGKGAFVFIKSELRGQEIFMPKAWENFSNAQ
jgi:hypothetical protein